MKTKQILSVAAVAAVMAVTAAAAHAADAPAEKCFGVVKAGKNDCKSAAHSCAGHSAKDGDAGEFLKLPAGLCASLSGGTVGK
jgi:uncharacterized membrane protein